ncbi:hypothetical protein TNCV_2524811 [Trichonephila clavipes]|nr:hypothetical protein TNCV_2524811 [Trichonephila clavipes]
MSILYRAQQRCEGERYPVGKLPLEREWQHYRLNYQTDLQIGTQCVWDSHKSAPAVIRNCSSPVYLGRRQLGCRRSHDLILTNTWSSLAPRKSLL